MKTFSLGIGECGRKLGLELFRTTNGSALQDINKMHDFVLMDLAETESQMRDVIEMGVPESCVQIIHLGEEESQAGYNLLLVRMEPPPEEGIEQGIAGERGVGGLWFRSREIAEEIWEDFLLKFEYQISGKEWYNVFHSGGGGTGCGAGPVFLEEIRRHLRGERAFFSENLYTATIVLPHEHWQPWREANSAATIGRYLGVVHGIIIADNLHAQDLVRRAAEDNMYIETEDRRELINRRLVEVFVSLHMINMPEYKPLPRFYEASDYRRQFLSENQAGILVPCFCEYALTDFVKRDLDLKGAVFDTMKNHQLMEFELDSFEDLIAIVTFPSTVSDLTDSMLKNLESHVYIAYSKSLVDTVKVTVLAKNPYIPRFLVLFERLMTIVDNPEKLTSMAEKMFPQNFDIAEKNRIMEKFKKEQERAYHNFAKYLRQRDYFDRLPEEMKRTLSKLAERDKNEAIAQADDLEYDARLLIANQNYSEAKTNLEKVIEMVPEREETLKNEFGFLFDFEISIGKAISSKDKRRRNENKKLTRWREDLWYVVSERNDFPLEKMREKRLIQSANGEEVEGKGDEPARNEPKGTSDSEFSPQERGEKLEKAVLKLFRQFFVLAEEQEKTVQLKLRQQKKGTQFGHDISFECTVKENRNVKCHIECRNKGIGNNITLKDIADKLASTKAFCPDIDHWILISPHCSPSSELDNLLDLWHKNKEYPFEIQIWCPETGVKEFFGLSPAIYDLFYKSEEDETHPNQWPKEKCIKVIEKWNQKLKPITRLPRGWNKYVREPFRICIDDKEQDEFEVLYQHYISMKCMDERKNILGPSLENYVSEWLKDPKTPVMLLLGGFGDGKTAFTYILSRNLIGEFLENQSEGWIPVRFALKNYYSAGNSREFLRERLEEFGADIDGWRELKGKHKLNRLVILDGFDEMTKELDQDTITKNLNSLIKCCDEFKGSKVLITSRTYFFENQRNKERLLQRLPPHCVFYLAPIDRRTNIRHLEEFAKTPEEKKKLRNICRLHDPIGLASKPLFLQMIKETLNELPEENLDESTLYNVYIRKSLYRKIDNLDYDRLGLTPEEIYSNLIEMMEEIAMKIQKSGENYFSLEEYQSTSKQAFAEILWKISGPEKDAMERVRIRSLLTQVKTEKNTDKLAVDFCHRSIREYFVARSICRDLRKNRESVEEFLSDFLVGNEVLHFTAKLMREINTREYERKLLYLIETTRDPNQGKYLGGNAATLLFRLRGGLPESNWSGLNLDCVDLSGADLSNKNFRGTSLCYARLDNVNFEGADLSYCNLTGVRIEETAPVLAVTIHPLSNRIIAAYGDNTIREWDIVQGSENKTRIVYENTNGTIIWMKILFDFDLCAFTNDEVIFYDFENDGRLFRRARFRKKQEYRGIVTKRGVLLLVSDRENQESEILQIDLQQRKIVGSLRHGGVKLCENPDKRVFVLSEGKNSLRIIEATNSHEKERVFLATDHEVTSLCVNCCKENNKYLIACGQRNGEVLVWQVDFSRDEWVNKLLLRRHVHDKLVSSVAFLDDSTIISGSIDRKICILEFRLEEGTIMDIQENALHLTVRCKGMKIEGLRSTKEYEMLRKLILKAEKADDNEIEPCSFT